MRALVTGGTGFLGSHLVRTLLDSGDEVCVLLRPESDTWRVRDLLGELLLVTAKEPLQTGAVSAVGEFRPQVIYHLAWAGSHGCARSDTQHLSTNLEYTSAVLALALEHRCESVVGLGSQAEYGPRAGVLDEECPLRPRSAYGVGKLAAGLMIDSAGAALGIRCAWLRLLSAYGPRDAPDYVIPYVIRELLERRSPSLTSAAQPHDTLFCRDVCRALRAAALSERCRGAYVLASAAPMLLREVAELIRELIGAEAPAIAYGGRAGHPGWRGSHARFTRDTGWAPETSLADGLRETIQWHRHHADG